MFYSKGMSHLGFPLQTTRAKGMTTTTTAIPLRFLFFLASNLAALHHTRRHHHEQQGKAIEMGKMERGEESQPVFGEERRGSTKTCPSFPSLPLHLPSLFFHAREWRRKGGRADGLGFGKGRGTVLEICPRGNHRDDHISLYS